MMTDAELDEMERDLPVEADGGCEGHYGGIVARGLLAEVRRLRPAERLAEAISKHEALITWPSWHDDGAEEVGDALVAYRLSKSPPAPRRPPP